MRSEVAALQASVVISATPVSAREDANQAVSAPSFTAAALASPEPQSFRRRGLFELTSNRALLCSHVSEALLRVAPPSPHKGQYSCLRAAELGRLAAFSRQPTEEGFLCGLGARSGCVSAVGCPATTCARHALSSPTPVRVAAHDTPSGPPCRISTSGIARFP